VVLFSDTGKGIAQSSLGILIVTGSTYGGGAMAANCTGYQDAYFAYVGTDGALLYNTCFGAFADRF
jgi:hypothetical protein